MDKREGESTVDEKCSRAVKYGIFFHNSYHLETHRHQSNSPRGDSSFSALLSRQRREKKSIGVRIPATAKYRTPSKVTEVHAVLPNRFTTSTNERATESSSMQLSIIPCTWLVQFFRPMGAHSHTRAARKTRLVICKIRSFIIGLHRRI